MSLLKKTSKLLSSIGRQFELVVDDISSGLKSLTKRPFRDLKRARKRNAKGKESKFGWVSVLIWPAMLCVSIASVLGRILLSPAELMVGLARRKASDVLWAFPGLIALLVIVFLGFGGLKSDSGLQEMRRSAVLSFQNKDYEKAANQYETLIKASSNPSPTDQLNWTKSLFAIGETTKAIELLKQIAPGPGETSGSQEAHQFVAISIANKLKKPVDAVTLNALRWHLECGGSTMEPGLNQAWAKYYLAVNNKADALRHLKLAAEINPEFMVMVADIYASMGRESDRKAALDRAADFFESLVDEQPKDFRHRILYSKILVELEKLELAEQVLLDGLKKTAEPALQNAIAEFYLEKYRRADPKLPFDERFSLIKKSLSHNANLIPAYDELVQFYRKSENEADKSAILEALNEMIRSNESAALAHFALSNIYWSHNRIDESRQHMERAFELDQRFAAVANNLAWLLADADDPDLDRAYDLAIRVVQKHPNNGRFRDTLATVMMKQNRNDEALAEFQKALRSIPDKKSVHQKMATIYRSMDREDLAKRHQDQADAAQ